MIMFFCLGFQIFGSSQFYVRSYILKATSVIVCGLIFSLPTGIFQTANLSKLPFLPEF